MARVIQSEQAMFVLVLREAQAGDAGAQCQVGRYYLRGKGVTVNPGEALFWLLKAAHQGNASAQRIVGNIYAREFQEYEKAIRWYRMAANAGNAMARFNLGIMYQIGYGVEKDYCEAFQWQQLSAQQGYRVAQFNVGLLHADGKGTPQDDVASFEWLYRAGEQNHATAQYNVGMAYENGKGVARDRQNALRWYKKAAGNGEYSAQVALAAALLETGPAPGDAKTGQAYVWMTLASLEQPLPDPISGRFSAIKRDLPKNETAALDTLAAQLAASIRLGATLPRGPLPTPTMAKNF